MKLFLAILLLPIFTFGGTLESGTEYSATLYGGTARTNCDFNRYTSCYSYELAPAMYTRFTTNTDADRFVLTATHESGKKRTKKGKLKEGKSKKLNLWINTLTQRALLDEGKNILMYTLTKNGQTVEQGEFVVNVTRESNVHCGDFYVPVWDRNSCSNSSLICSTYFSQYARCE